MINMNVLTAGFFTIGKHRWGIQIIFSKAVAQKINDDDDISILHLGKFDETLFNMFDKLKELWFKTMVFIRLLRPRSKDNKTFRIIKLWFLI